MEAGRGSRGNAARLDLALGRAGVTIPAASRAYRLISLTVLVRVFATMVGSPPWGL